MPEDVFPVVALASSVGGLDATSEVLRELPPDFPAAVLVLRHLSPDAPSVLSDILARRCALPVREAVDGDVLRPGTVLVAPAGVHTLVGRGDVVRLVPSGGWPPYRPSADLLLTSLALTTGERAIAVVLTGKGSDGATGATAVAHCGGVVVATDPGSSREPEMPSTTAERDDAVDFVVPLAEVPALLRSLVSARLPAQRGARDG